MKTMTLTTKTPGMLLKTRVLATAALALMAGACVEDEFGRDLDEDDRIIGGQDTDIRTVPWQVSLQKWGGHHCGGSILNSRWILSAAHCMNVDHVRAGVTKKNGDGQLIKIAKTHVYPDYGDNYVNDVMLVELEEPLELDGETTRAIALATECDASEYAPGRDAIVSGWGQTIAGSSTSMKNTLQSVVVSMLSDSEAKEAYGGYFQQSNMIAAAADGKDACQGDSGGPLAVDWNGDPMLVGIVSWGHGCASATHPGVYARVPRFVEWIDEVTGGVQHRSCNGQDGAPEPDYDDDGNDDGGADSSDDPDDDGGDGDNGGDDGGGGDPELGDQACCEINYIGSGCSNAEIQACVCAQDDYCCSPTGSWDQACVENVEAFGCGVCGGGDDGAGGGDGGAGGDGGGGDGGGSPEVGEGACCEKHLSPGCNDGAIQACVCADDPYCCDPAGWWDDQCANKVESLGCGTC